MYTPSMRSHASARNDPVLALLLTGMLLLAGTAPLAFAENTASSGNAAGKAPAASRGQKPSIDASALAKRIHTRINAERGRNGLSSLAWDDALSRIAAMHSRDMADRKYLSHDSPEGNGFPVRYRQAGYACGIRIGNVIHTGSENIALSHLYDSITTVNAIEYYHWISIDKIAEGVANGWMNSPGHRKNILTPHWKHEGIGVMIGPDDKVYVTQNFC
jgi:uncharacterized protein YkwD